MQFFLQLNSPLGPGFGPSLTLSTIPGGTVTPSIITLQQALNGIPITVPNNTTVVVITSTGDTSCVINFAVPTTTQDPCLNSGGIATLIPTTCTIGTLNCTVLPPGFTTTTSTTLIPTTTTSTSTTSTSTSTTTTTTANPCATAICGITYEGYGYLYNWYAIYGAGAKTNGGRNTGAIVNINQPAGNPNTWIVPSDTDWTNLTTFLGGQSIAGGKLKTTCTRPLSTNSGIWNAINIGATNEVSWSGVPGGFRNSSGSFITINDYGFWWSSTEDGSVNAWSRDLFNNSSDVVRGANAKVNGFSLRLVRPATTPELSLPDGATSISHPSILKPYIGNEIATLPGPTVKRNVYITVKIGNQVWTTQNLIEETYNNGSIISEQTNAATWSTLITGARCSYNNGSITANQGQIELCGSTPPSAVINVSLFIDNNGIYSPSFKAEKLSGTILDTLSFSLGGWRFYNDTPISCQSQTAQFVATTGNMAVLDTSTSIDSSIIDMTGSIPSGTLINSYKFTQLKINGVIMNLLGSEPYVYLHPTTGNIYHIVGWEGCLNY